MTLRSPPHSHRLRMGLAPAENGVLQPATAVTQVDVIDAELLKPWERKRQEYKQRKKVCVSTPQARGCTEEVRVT